MQRICRTPRTATARLAMAAGFVLPCFICVAAALAEGSSAPVVTNYSMLNNVKVTSYVAAPVQSPPINGFIPRVVMTMTNEPGQLADAFAVEEAYASGAQPQPLVVPPKYLVATFDTGAQSHIISYGDRAASGIDGYMTNNYVDVIGASGSEEARVSKPVGAYIAGFADAGFDGEGSLTASGMIKGHRNLSVLAAEDPQSLLPNIIGAPIAAHYQVAILNSEPQTLTVGTTTYHSPSVTLMSLNPPEPEPRPTLPSNYYRMTLDVMSPAGISPTPIYVPNNNPFDANFGEPTTSSFWMSLFANVSGNDAANSVSGRQFLFDTGAQVTVLSQDTAAEYGFYSGGPEPSEPEFTVEVVAVGGSMQVPGFYVDSLRVLTNGGYVTWNNVPVLVLDVPDARDGVGYLPGILGMNLFTDRDLILNGGLENPAVAFSQQFQWNVNGSGLWSESGKWIGGTPDTATHAAQFLGKITSPQTITVNGDYTIGNLTFDNANRYTIAGTGRLTLETHDNPAVVGVYSGSHTVNALVTLASETIFNISQPASKLTITSDVTATGIDITKQGPGTLELKNVRAHSLVLDNGTVAIMPNGASAATSILNDISATNGTLDLQNNKLIVRGAAAGGSGELGGWSDDAYSGVTGLIANGNIIAAPTARTTVGVATADQAALVGQSFGGQTVLTGDVLVTRTWAGDANLDGIIDGDDFFQIDNGFTGDLVGYFNGDFDYSGTIDADDYFLIDSNYAAGSTPLGLTLAAVPEPAGISLILAGFGLLYRRWRV